MDFILGINTCFIFKQKKSKRYCGNNKSCKQMSLYKIYHLVEWWSHLHNFFQAVFYRGGWRERDYILAAANTNWHSDMTNNNSQKDNTDTTPMLLSSEGKHDQVWVLKPCKSGQSDTCGGTDTLLPEMFLCFNESWYQPARNVSSPANLALGCKTNIKVEAGEDSC